VHYFRAQCVPGWCEAPIDFATRDTSIGDLGLVAAELARIRESLE
jgi:hypothetical protein